MVYMKNNFSLEEQITKLYEQAKNDGFATNLELSDEFFKLSELRDISKKERDFVLDMSVYLGDDEESRGYDFNPEEFIY